MTALYEPDWPDQWCRKPVPVYEHPFTGAGYCGAAAPYVDEVTGEIFCAEHAGPLAWDDRTINLYSLAVRLAGHLDVPVTTKSSPQQPISDGIAPVAWRSENERRRVA